MARSLPDAQPSPQLLSYEMGITLVDSLAEEDLPSEGLTDWEFESMDRPQGWVINGILVGFFPSIPPRAPSRTRKMTKHWASVCSTPSGPRRPHGNGSRTSSWRLSYSVHNSNGMLLTRLNKQPRPLPKGEGEALSSHTVIISASKTCQLSFPHTKPS